MVGQKVLILGKVEHANTTLSHLAKIAKIVTPKATNRADFIAECINSQSHSSTSSTSSSRSASPSRFSSFVPKVQGPATKEEGIEKSSSWDGVKVLYRTFESTSITGRVDDEILDVLPSSLRFICHNGAGYDSVDVAACTSRGIFVSNAPGVPTDATGDLAVFLMLGAMRSLNGPMVTLRAGQWRGDINAPTKSLPAPGHDPRGKVLGLLGMGSIGRNFAKKAALAFGMRIRYHTRTRLPEELEREYGNAIYTGFEELLKNSDILSLHIPLNPQTHHFISTEEFALMKHGVVVLNTARGAIIDEAALVAALDAGNVASAGLDVFEHEPDMIHPGLLANPRVMLTPHMGTWTVETQARMEEWTLSNVCLAIEEDRLRSIVPEQKNLASWRDEEELDEAMR